MPTRLRSPWHFFVSDTRLRESLYQAAEEGRAKDLLFLEAEQKQILRSFQSLRMTLQNDSKNLGDSTLGDCRGRTPRASNDARFYCMLTEGRER